MKTDLVMPQMGESVAEGTVTKWYAKPGESVRKDQTVLSISTDKVDAEIPAPVPGVLVELLVPEGQKVAIGAVLARIESEATSQADSLAAQAVRAAAATAELAPPEPAARGPAGGPSPAPIAPPPVVPQPAPQATPPPAGPHDRSGFFSPLVLSIARAENVTVQELASIQGSGIGGRVQKRDLLAYLEWRRAGHPAVAGGGPPSRTPTAPPAAKAPPALAPAPVTVPPSAPSPAPPAGVDVEVVAMDSMRRAIAEHMVRSVQTSPHVTSIHEVDMTRIARFVERARESFLAREGFPLTFTPFFVESAVRALQQFPAINASVDGSSVLLKRRIAIGVAVALEGGGLIVPVVKNAETLNLVGLARAVHDLAARARARKLSPDDVAGGTFTITNLGSAGTLTGTPIINQPQVAILGTGLVVKRPVVVDDAIAIRHMMFLSMSYDHRLIDGMLAGRFLNAVKQHLEAFELEGIVR